MNDHTDDLPPEEPTPITPGIEIQDLAEDMTPDIHPITSPYMVWVNIEGPLVPASEPGGKDGDYFFTATGWLVLYFAIDPGDRVQVILGHARQIYFFPKGAPAFTRLLQVPVLKEREPEKPKSPIVGV